VGMFCNSGGADHFVVRCDSNRLHNIVDRLEFRRSCLGFRWELRSQEPGGRLKR
jgi:hypothetical protein